MTEPPCPAPAGPGTPRARRGSSRSRAPPGCGPIRPALSPRSARSTRCRRSRRRCRRRRTLRPPRRTRRARVLGGHIAGDRDRRVAERRDRVGGALAVDVERDDARAGLRQRFDDGPTDAAGGAGDERDLALELTRRRRQRQLVQLQRPVLDREALGLVERDELGDGARRRPSPRSRGGTDHARAARPAPGADRDQPDVLDQHDARIRVGHLCLRRGARSRPRIPRYAAAPATTRSASISMASVAGSYGTHIGSRLVWTR